MSTTVQFLISHARLMNQLIQLLDQTDVASIFNRQQSSFWEEIRQEGFHLVEGAKDLGLSIGAGLFPNTFEKAGTYRIINNATEEGLALADGWRPATFPQTMILFGAPDVVVHNSVEKDSALDAGYTLPGLPRSVAPGA